MTLTKQVIEPEITTLRKALAGDPTNEYLRGLANSLIWALSYVEGKSPTYIDKFAVPTMGATLAKAMRGKP